MILSKTDEIVNFAETGRDDSPGCKNHLSRDDPAELMLEPIQCRVRA